MGGEEGLTRAGSRLGGHNYDHASEEPRQESVSVPYANVPNSWSLDSGTVKPLRWTSDIPWHPGGTERWHSVSLAGLRPRPTSPG